MNVLSDVGDGKADSREDFRVGGFQESTDQLQASDEAPDHVPGVGSVLYAGTHGPSGTGLNLSNPSYSFIYTQGSPRWVKHTQFIFFNCSLIIIYSAVLSVNLDNIEMCKNHRER